MTSFSEESNLLIERWRTVEDVLAAAEQLGRELTSLLYSLESQLSGLDWWSEGWTFERYRNVQVYISNEAWHVGDRYAIWIGIEGVTPGAMFGSGSAPQMYVWVNNRSPELLSALVDRLQSSDLELPGDIDARMSNFYAARQPAMKYIGGDIGDYTVSLKQQVIDFFTSYAQWLWGMDSAIQQHLQADRSAGPVS